MGVDVSARLPPRVAVEPVAEHLHPADQPIAAEHLLHHFLIDAEEIEKLGEVGRVPFAAQIGFGDADIAALEQPRTQSRNCKVSWPPTGPASVPPSGSVRPSGRVTSSVPRLNLEPKPSASRTALGRSGTTESTVSGVTQIKADIVSAHRSMRPCVQSNASLTGPERVTAVRACARQQVTSNVYSGSARDGVRMCRSFAGFSSRSRDGLR